MPIPALVSAVVEAADPNALVLTFSQPLTSDDAVTAGGMTLTGDTALTATGYTVVGAVVTVALSRAVVAAEVVTVSYTPPATDPLGNANGLVAAFAGQAVTNNVV